MKKIILILLLVFSFLGFSESFAQNPKPSNETKSKEQLKKEYEEECRASKNCLEQSTWTLDVSGFVPGKTFDEDGIEKRADELFEKIIKSFMVALGVLSVFMMTIGGGYMILHNGQDELLNKGKSIFMAGIYSVAIALISYFLVDIVANILY